MDLFVSEISELVIRALHDYSVDFEEDDKTL